MTTLQCYSDLGDSLRSEDAADRAAFLLRDSVSVKATCSVATSPPTTLVRIDLRDPGRAAHRGKRLSSAGPSPASTAKSRVGPLPERSTSIWGRNWLSPGRAALPHSAQRVMG